MKKHNGKSKRPLARFFFFLTQSISAQWRRYIGIIVNSDHLRLQPMIKHDAEKKITGAIVLIYTPLTEVHDYA